jgi:tryptophan synthase alpha chain
MNALTELLSRKNKNLLSIYFTAGYPRKDSTVKIIHSLRSRGVDFLEVGFPFSDPLADGPVIQQTSYQAIENGMSLEYLLQQLKEEKNAITIPLVLMGYLNPVLHMGMENFCRKAGEAGVSGVILPDLPPEEYIKEYKALFMSNNLHMIFLVTPETGEERIRMIDRTGSGFIYAVSSSSTTGKQDFFSSIQTDYLKRLKSMNLDKPVMTGFGIHNDSTLKAVWEHSAGAIIGTAYLRALMKSQDEQKAADIIISQLGLKK